MSEISGDTILILANLAATLILGLYTVIRHCHESDCRIGQLVSAHFVNSDAV